MEIQKHILDTTQFNLSSTKNELLTHLSSHRDPQSHTWGFFPELNPDLSQYPECSKLLSSLQFLLFPKLNITPAFIRVATKEPVSDFGGLHIDVSPGIGHKKVHQTGEILRILVNLGDTPRKLEYVPYTLSELNSKFKYSVPESEYSIIKLPASIPTKIIEIPPIEKNCLYSLSFVSSQIIHAGRTDSNGHFLACFGGFTP